MVPLGRWRKSGYKYAAVRSPTLCRRSSDISSNSIAPSTSPSPAAIVTSTPSTAPTSPSSNRAVVVSALSFATIPSTEDNNEELGQRALPPPTPRVTRPRNDSCPPAFNLSSSSSAVPVRSQPSPTRGSLGKLVGTLPRHDSTSSLVSRDRSHSVGSASSSSPTTSPQHLSRVSRRSGGSAVVRRSKEIVRRLSDEMDLLSLSSSGESSEDDLSMPQQVKESAKWFTRSVASRDLIRASPSSPVISPASAAAAQNKQKRRSVVMSGPIFNSFSALPTTSTTPTTGGKRSTSTTTTASWSSSSSPFSSTSSFPVRPRKSHSAPPFRNVRVIESIPANTSLAYQTVFGELAIKCELKSGEMSSVHVATSSTSSNQPEASTIAGARIMEMETADVSLVRIDEQRPDFAEVERQLEAIYNFSKRGVEPELWYTDADGDTLKLHDSVGLQYAVEDWRYHLLPLRRQRNANGCPTTPPTPSMRLLINERRPQ